MLSYRHAYHAGNHADVLKHFTLCTILNYYNQKDKPYWYIDTHAGAGLYDLHSSEANKVGEYQQGIARLWAAHRLTPKERPENYHSADKGQPENHHPAAQKQPENQQPASLAAFAQFAQTLAAHEAMTQLYAGSPLWAAQLLRPADKLRLFELHPADFALLQDNLHALRLGKRAIAKQEDGFAGLISLLPPATRRAVVLIDPPYERKQDYAQVVHTLRDALKRFEQGCYMVWYPCLSREESHTLPEKLAKLLPDNHLRAELHVHAPRADGFGMHGSGMFILNPPYILDRVLREALPELARLLAQDNGAKFILNSQIR